MNRKAYKSDLTDLQWQLLEPLIPAGKPLGRHRSVDMRSRSQWYFLRPQDWMFLGDASPRLTTLLHSLLLLSALAKKRRLELNLVLRERGGIFWGNPSSKKIPFRQKLGKSPQATAAIVDSQSIKTTEKKEKYTARTVAS